MKQFLNTNKKVVGKMKNEVGNSEIVEAVSIKSKCYDYITKDDVCHKKLKGISYSVVKDEIQHKDYVDCILEGKVKNVAQTSLRSYNHEIYTIK